MKKTFSILITLALVLSLGLVIAVQTAIPVLGALPQLFENYNTGDNTYGSIYGSRWEAQTFTPSAAHTITSVKLLLYRVNSPGTIHVRITSTSGGKPYIIRCSGTIDGNSLTTSTSGDWYEITLGSGYPLSAGTQYAIVVGAPGGDGSNLFRWRADSSSPTYSGGELLLSTDGGGSWTAYPGYDFMFEEWGLAPTEVWVNDSWCSQTDVDAFNPSLIWQYDAFNKIQDGIDNVAGSTVHVLAGTYDGQVTINKSLTLIGAGEDQTFLKESTAASPVITVDADDVTIQDLEITDDTELDEGIRIDSCASTGLTVDHVDFTNLGAGTGANAYGIYIKPSFANLSVTNCDFVAVTHTTYYRTMGIFAPNSLTLSDFEVIDSTFPKIWTGIYLRSAIDGLDIIGNTFGPVESWDFKACVSGIYIGDGDDNNFDIENVVVTDNTFTDYGRGVYVWNYASGGEIISNFEIYENTFTNSVWSSAIRFIGGLNTNDEQVSFDGINVHDNTFTQDSDVGAHVALIDFRIYQQLVSCQIDITDNEITLSGGPYTDPWSGIAFLAYGGPFTNTVIDGNTLNGGSCGGTGVPPSSGVLLKHEGSTWPSGTLDMDIHCNDITGFDHGVTIYNNVASQYGDLPTGSNVNINNNNIHGNTLNGVRSGTGETVDAENNWWGDANGSGPYDPSGESGETTDVPPCSVSVAAMMNPDGTGDKVLGLVDYCPWIGEAYAPAKSVTPTTGGTANFTADDGNIVGLTAVSPTPPNQPVDLPYGVFSFQVCCIDPGQQVTVTVKLPGPVPVGSVWWKYQGGSWYALPIGSDDGDDTITITLTDGVFPGDTDSTPGQITDPGGPGPGISPFYRLDIFSTEGGSVTTPGEKMHLYVKGKVVNLVASPDDGYEFVEWIGDVDTIADVDDGSTTITIGNTIQWEVLKWYCITAKFEAEGTSATETSAQYVLTVSSTMGGSVTSPGEGASAYEAGTVVNLVASSDDGYEFVDWTGDGIINADSATTSVTMNDDYTVKATFGEITGTDDSGGESSIPVGACFIATAAYGTPTAEQIDVLREFRDVVLLENSVGSQFIALYYQLSPPVADFIAGNSFLKTVVRELVVDPVVWVVEATGDIWRN